MSIVVESFLYEEGGGLVDDVRGTSGLDGVGEAETVRNEEVVTACS